TWLALLLGRRVTHYKLIKRSIALVASARPTWDDTQGGNRTDSAGPRPQIACGTHSAQLAHGQFTTNAKTIMRSGPMGTDTQGRQNYMTCQASAENSSTLDADCSSPNDEIVMYTTTWCPDCRRAKRIFASVGVPYREVDVARHPDAAATV